MAVAALIAAYQEAEDGGEGLRALLPMAGRTLLEHQVRRAFAAGASHAVVLVERVPPALNAAIDRLRRDGIAVDIAREASDAADRFHPEEKVLLVADGLVAAPDCFEAMAAQTAPVLLVVSDIEENAEFERVDSHWRWAGLALTDVKTLSDTAAMLGEWDLQSTLMRRIVQAGARYVPVDGEGGAVAEAREAVQLAQASASTREAGRAMLARNRRGGEAWPERYVFPPLVGVVAPPLLDRGVEPFLLRLGAVALLLGGAFALWWGWLWIGLAPLLLAGPITAIAARIDLARLRDRAGGRELRWAREVAQALAILAMGAHFSAATGAALWLWSSIAALVLLALAGREAGLARKAGAPLGPLAPWIATGEGAIWLLPPFAIAGGWEYWPGAVALYAALSTAAVQHRLGEAVAAMSRGNPRD